MGRDGFSDRQFTPLGNRSLVPFRVRTVASLAVLLAAWLVPAPAAERMKMITRDTGWVALTNSLYWTSDGGINWTDIKPVVPGINPIGVRLESIFFLDASQGWAVISHPESVSTPTYRDFVTRKTVYEIAQTADAGRTWSLAPLTYPELPQWIQDTFAGPAGLYFLDSVHGWLDVAFEGNSKPGKLLATEDGGRTWNWVNSPGVSGAIGFRSMQDGWLSGGPDEKLFATHDGCHTWEEVRLTPPPQVGAATYPFFKGPPTFEDGQRGFLGVYYIGSPGTQPKLVIYSTGDGGTTWQPAKIVGEAEESGALTLVPFVVADSVLFVPTKSSIGTIVVAPVPLGGGLSTPVEFTTRGAPMLTFAGRTHGWAVSWEGELSATDDAGATWREISGPWRVPNLGSGPVEPLSRAQHSGAKPSTPSVPGVAPPGPRGPSLKSPRFEGTPAAPSVSGPQALTSGGGGGLHRSVHLAFDTGYVLTQAAMLKWWQYSPYYDTFIYLPGSPNRGTDATLGSTASTWVSPVESQGWGIIPVWFGLQPICVIDATNISHFISSNPAADGTSEAQNAANAAAMLGLSNTIIYKDMENYDTNNATCAAAVTAYVGAWGAELHSLGYQAGVYANAAPLELNISGASPLPDEVWVAGYDNRATIWGVGTLNDNRWPTHQRSHQYVGPTVTEVYGATSNQIDRDIEDASVAGSSGGKFYSSYTTSATTITYQGASTYLTAINDAYLGQNPPAAAQVAGYQPLSFPAGACGYGGPCDTGLYWDRLNGFRSISFSTQAEANGLNDHPYVVGVYNTSLTCPGHYYGYMYDATTGASQTINFLGAWSTFPQAINDAGQVVGYYYSTDCPSSTEPRGFFLDYSGKWTSLNYPGALATWVTGINGAGQMVGQYQDSSGTHNFIYSQADGWTTLSCGRKVQFGIGNTITNNGQALGGCGGGSSGAVPLYDFAHGTTTQVFFSGLGCGYQGLNDAAVVAGSYQDSGGTVHGCYAIPNP